MTKEELITHLQDIEWEDFEAKEAKDKVPSNVWESVSAFSNTSGGWIVFGVKQEGKKFEVQGVSPGILIECQNRTICGNTTRCLYNDYVFTFRKHLSPQVPTDMLQTMSPNYMH